MDKRLLHLTLALWLTVTASAVSAAPLACVDVLESLKDTTTLVPVGPISAKELSLQASAKIAVVPEFAYIREEAEKRGLRVWLFGGTASSYLHYVKWDLARKKGLMKLQADRFDYDFTNIFRSTQDLDIVIDASAEKAKEFQNIIAAKFPHFLGSKAAKWEVRTLRTRMGKPGDINFKEALLGDTDFSNQNTDSNSLGMVEVTRSAEPVIRDLKQWDTAESTFLKDTLSNRISFLRSSSHFTTARAKAGENPEIMSVVRLLVKAFQYELEFSDKDFQEMKSVVDAFDPSKIQNPNALRRLQDTAKKLVMHAVNIEYAMNKLDDLGLRKKLIALGDPKTLDTASWWLAKEPLRSKTVGLGAGKTAAELKISTVAHETNSFLAYESITRSHSGEPNVLISRQDSVGEAAHYGNGFYTRIGREGAKGTGLTIRFSVNPSAREGQDFNLASDFAIFHNKKALSVVQESLNFTLEDLVNLANTKDGEGVAASDKALLEKLKRRLNATMLNAEIEKMLAAKEADAPEKIIRFVEALGVPMVRNMFSEAALKSVLENLLQRLAPMAQSKNENELSQYVRTLGAMQEVLDVTKLKPRNQVQDALSSVGKNPDLSYDVRKAAATEYLLSIDLLLNLTWLDAHRAWQSYFTKAESAQFVNEIQAWKFSENRRKNKFYKLLSFYWDQALETEENKGLENLRTLTSLEIFDINQTSVSGVPALLTADYFGQNDIVEWLARNPRYNLSAKNKQGFNQIEQLRLLRKYGLADRIQSWRPEVRARQLKVRDRNNDGSPIVDFVRIDPGSFMMGRKDRAVLTQITKPFQIMSIPTTTATWMEVTLAIQENFPQEYDLNAMPSRSTLDDRVSPVDHVSYNDVQQWFAGLNRLSNLENQSVQNLLKKLFPRHRRGDHYRLPTNEEREYVHRNQGLASGAYSFGGTAADLVQYAWTKAWTGPKSNQPHPVGTKLPLMINGRPVYDIQGNVWEMTELAPGAKNVVWRGGSFADEQNGIFFTTYGLKIEHTRTSGIDLSFRIVRDVRVNP